jgi:arylsulfatase A-like enzyme
VIARRRRLGLALVLASVLTVSSGAPGAPTAVEEPPNIVVVMTDDQTQESMRVMAAVRSLLATKGTTFVSSFASVPFCCPSRATFLTGQYAHNHQVRGNLPPKGGYQKLDNANTLAVWLQAANYRTAHVGKYLNGYGLGDPTKVPPGWTEWFTAIEPSLERYYDYQLNENGTLVDYGSDAASYKSDVFTRHAVDLVDKLAPDGPFFLWVSYLAPHAGQPVEPGDPSHLETPVAAPRHQDAFDTEPLPLPPSFNEEDVSDKPTPIRKKRRLGAQRIAAVTENYRQRLESLLAVDEGVADIVAALTNAGELDNTIVIFTSDNGFFHGEHRISHGKERVYEPSVRVPLVLRGPGVAAGRKSTQLVANVDLAPTIVELAGATVGLTMDGRSLVPLLEDPSEEWNRAIVLESWTAADFSAVRTDRYVYADYPTFGETELYDLADDPHQLVSRHDDPAYTEIEAELAERLAALRRCRGSACWS